MRIILTGKRSRKRWKDVPKKGDYEHALVMLEECREPQYDASGGDAHRNSVAGRVVFGLFANDTTPNPTIAMNDLLQEICRRKGAGLNGK